MFFLQSEYAEQGNNEMSAGGQNQRIAQVVEKDEGTGKLSLDLNRLKNKSQIQPPSNAFGLGVCLLLLFSLTFS